MAGPGGLYTIAVCGPRDLTVNGERWAITAKDSAGLRQLLSGAGVRSVIGVGAGGVFYGSEAEMRNQDICAGRVIDSYGISFEGRQRDAGGFSGRAVWL